MTITRKSTVNLGDLSDAELGALVRRSMQATALQALVENRPKADRAALKRAKQAKKLALAERVERATPQRWVALTIPGDLLSPVRVPTLDLTDQRWQEVAPATVQDAYRRALAAIGAPRDHEEELTWRDCKGVHLMLLGNYAIEPNLIDQGEVLARALGISAEEAINRLLDTLGIK